ncbi:MAG: hypothetical protein RR724_08630, partial [Hydrogenoanaerobacterium sp.]
AGLALKDDYIRQAVDYGSNSGVDWVILTNGVYWKVYKIIFAKPVENELIYEFDFTELSAKKQSDLEMLYYISRESISKITNTLLSEFAEQKHLLNQFFIGQVLMTDTIVEAIRRQMRKIAPEAKVSNEEISDILMNLVIKRDVFEGDKSDEAKKRIQKYERAMAKQQVSKPVADESSGPIEE